MISVPFGKCLSSSSVSPLSKSATAYEITAMIAKKNEGDNLNMTGLVKYKVYYIRNNSHYERADGRYDKGLFISCLKPLYFFKAMLFIKHMSNAKMYWQAQLHVY